ncbi:MAG: hypothetical protein WKF84_03330 [Pyrinomonadaceae bacterium]
MCEATASVVRQAPTGTPATERLGQRHNIRHDAGRSLTAREEPIAGATDTGLHFVEDQRMMP